jgi:hypothetical protein
MRLLFIYIFAGLFSINGLSQEDDFLNEEMEGRYVYEEEISMGGGWTGMIKKTLTLNYDGTFVLEIINGSCFQPLPRFGTWKVDGKRLLLAGEFKNGVYSEVEKGRIRFKNYPEFKIGKEEYKSEVVLQIEAGTFKPHVWNCVIR